MRSMFCKQYFSLYAPQGSLTTHLGIGYMLIDFIDKDTGTLLSTTWNKHKYDKEERAFN